MPFKHTIPAMIGVVMGLTAFDASALETISGHVTYIEATYLPTLVQFTLDGASPSCPAGHNLLWQKADASNNRAVYAALMFAMGTGKRITVYINDGDSSCTGQYFQILSN